MSSVACPLCGKNSPFSSFKPERLDDDIYIVKVTGLGRGRGFATESKESILDSGSDDDIASGRESGHQKRWETSKALLVSDQSS